MVDGAETIQLDSRCTNYREESQREDVQPRETWSHGIEFLLASIGCAVGFGNVWRFPHLCYRNGGGAFLIPYVIMNLLCAFPLLLVEYTIGQYTRFGPVRALAQICPLFKGVGLGIVVISCMWTTFYNVLMAWDLYYLFSSFSFPFPWQTCNNTWNTDSNCSSHAANATHTQSASEQFFDHKVLEMTKGIEEAGGVRWELFGLHTLVWIIVYFSVFKGIKSTGKVVYFTALFPYFVLFALLINNIQLPGAKDGILYFITPNWNKLLEAQLWMNAAAQIFYSTGIACGSMMTMASYNKYNNNIFWDTFVVCLADPATSILTGVVIFSAIGYMAHIHNLPVDDIATAGPGLVFVVYPEAFPTMPLAQLWAPLFFFMLLCLGIDTKFVMVEVAVTCIMDSFGAKVKRKELMVLAVCSVGLLLGIPFITRGGVYAFQLMEHYTLGVSFMILAFCQILAVTLIFGARRICVMVESMTGRRPNLYLRVCWQFLSPMLILGILIFNIIQYNPPRLGKSYTYPPWAEHLGWFISLIPIIWIPLGAAHEIWRNEGSLLQRLKVTLTPTLELKPKPAKCSDQHGALLEVS